MASPPACIVIPTRDRAAYLAVALDSLAAQTRAAGAEIVVVADDGDAPTLAVCAHAGVTRIPRDRRLSANAARNAGTAASTAPLIVFLDDDVLVHPGWLPAYLAAAEAHPEVDVFAGRIVARMEGPTPRSCGRHGPAISFLDLGPQDRETPYGWGANMMIRRSALERVGPLDPTFDGAGEEEEWQDRLHAAGGRVRYLAAAAVDHRRAGPDARLRPLARAGYARGRTSRRYDVRQRAQPGRAPLPSLAEESDVLLRCLLHAGWRRCGVMLVLAAHRAGRVHEALTPAAQEPAEDFLSGTSGHVAGRRAIARRLADRGLDALERGSGRQARFTRHAAEQPARSVLALIVRRTNLPNTAEASAAELRRSRHRIQTVIVEAGTRGKFENVNLALAERGTEGPGEEQELDWLLVVDDDVVLPPGFLDRFLLLAERHGLELAQPAQTLASHAAWPITRRRPGSAVRETSYVEIGPVIAFHRETFPTLLPFPSLRAAWGLDHHWAAIARERGWPIGIVDATPVRHDMRMIATHYPNTGAIAEAKAFLDGRAHVTRAEIRTLATHRDWR